MTDGVRVGDGGRESLQLSHQTEWNSPQLQWKNWREGKAGREDRRAAKLMDTGEKKHISEISMALMLQQLNKKFDLKWIINKYLIFLKELIICFIDP